MGFPSASTFAKKEIPNGNGQNEVNALTFKLPSVTLANYGTAVPGKYGQIKKLQIVFTGRYEA